ncbi:MAG: hypothetical protein E7438_06160 [Ruminococcaceae bacterium]|nr:hypothetical protein [Oscillospiraceae bacterium]
MNIEKRSARFGAALLIFAALLRLVGAIWMPQADALGLLQMFHSDFLPHRASGGVSPGPSTGVTMPTAPRVETQCPTVPTAAPTLPTVSTAPALPPQPEIPPAIRFAQEDLAYVKFRVATDCGYTVDLQSLLLQPLQWQLAGEEPTVLIIHSHATESYEKQPTDTYTENDYYRTLDTGYNMVAVGDLLTDLLRQRGIGVIHDRQIHDYPSYNAAYVNSGKAVADYLQAYPSIRLVLDLHRDAALNPDGSQFATSATVDGQRSAQIMLLSGSDWTGTSHPAWQENLSLALKLQVLLEQENPGITRRTVLRGSAFNQYLSTGMLIVEIGTAGNTLTEALRAVPPLAEAICALAWGAEA